MEGYKVGVVGGAGHVGAPLAVTLALKGWPTLIYDINRDALDQLRQGSLGFMEEGGDEALQQALKLNRLGFTDTPEPLGSAEYVIIIIGTPLDEYHNPMFNVVFRCVDQLLPHLRDGQTLILRSTVFPGVTDYLHRHLRQQGRDLLVAFCPERVVQGAAIREIQSLPQIISGTTPEAVASAARLFSGVAPSLVEMQTTEAEFAKLMCNAFRYIQFAAANQFYVMAESAGLDFARILEGAKRNYPRAAGLPGPGFTAGPCLFKDTLQLFAFSNNQFALGQTAMTVNEGLPNYIVANLKRKYDLTKSKVGILGMAFKSDIDDTRQSLSYKLGKILRFSGATVLYSDEFATDPTFVTKEQLLAECGIVIVGVPHTAYRGLRVPPSTEVVDLWGVLEVANEGRVRLAA